MLVEVKDAEAVIETDEGGNDTIFKDGNGGKGACD